MMSDESSEEEIHDEAIISKTISQYQNTLGEGNSDVGKENQLLMEVCVRQDGSQSPATDVNVGGMPYLWRYISPGKTCKKSCIIGFLTTTWVPTGVPRSPPLKFGPPQTFRSPQAIHRCRLGWEAVNPLSYPTRLFQYP